ncbi:MAG: hypothetical protein ACRDKD_00555 [Solirubrobacteraceae bacterium]
MVLALLPVASGQAAILHEYKPEVSEKIDEGVPASSGAAMPGPIVGAFGLTTDSGRLWVAEPFEEETGRSRADAFDGTTGAFASQLDEAPSLVTFENGIAVGHGTGEEEVYVGSNGAAVGVFGPSGALQATWTGAGTPNGSFTESGGESVANLHNVAVDNSTNTLADWAAGDVYVTTARRERFTGEEFQSYNVVDVFAPEAGGAEPSKVVARITGTCEAPGTCPGKVVPFTSPRAVAVSAQTGEVLVVDYVGNASVVDVFQPVGLDEYSFVRQLTGTCPKAGTCPGEEIPFGGVSSVAVDSGNGEIYVGEFGGAVQELSAEGEFLGRITGTPSSPLGTVRSVAVDGTSHDLYVGDTHPGAHSATVDVFGPDLIVPDVTTGAASEVTPSGATLAGTVNPDGQGEAMCWFAYGTTTTFGSEARCSKPVPEGESPVAVQATIEGGLESDTTYYYRLQASNANGTDVGEESQDRQFKTAGAGIHAESAAGVASTSATLQATIDPNGEATSYYFEYGTSDEYGSSAPAAPGTAVGPVEAEVVEHVQGLQPGTLYHYRVVAVAEVAPGRTQAFAGPDRTLSTQSSATGHRLPDGREWELVSPADKHGAEIEPTDAVTQAAASGGALAFVTTAPTENGPPGFANFVQAVSRRSSSGWVTNDISPPHEAAVGINVGDYHFFDEGLEHAIAEPVGAFLPLAASASEQTPYLRDVLSGEGLCATNCYTPLVTGCPAVEAECRPAVAEHADVPAGTAFGEEGKCPPPEGSAILATNCGPQALAATADLKHVILESRFALTSDAPSGGALYEWSAGSLDLISVLPNGEAIGSNSYFVGEEASRVTRHAVSPDGSRVVWGDKNHAYLRDVAAGETVRIDAPEPGASGAGADTPTFQLASRNTKIVYFTDQQALTTDAGPGDNLYRCELVVVAGKDRCALLDLTPETGGVPGEVIQNVTGASEDGSWVYFVANGVLAPGARAGTCEPTGETFTPPPAESCSLYVWHEGVTKLVATLSAADGPDWNGFGQVGTLLKITARVSPDGQWFAFMSQRPLTGYDNRDAVTGERDEEAFLYDAATEHVLCVSCTPTGGRPTGVTYAETKEVLGSFVWPPSQRLAASLPGWAGDGLSDSASHQPRFLGDGGRMFFNSPDALVPQDSNGTGDVYEFEPAGVGDCNRTADSGTTVFVAADEGCVSLVSSGDSSQESLFVDASESGGDVFFLTTAQLVGADGDRAFDLYDAHECTAGAPCYPSPPATAPPCDTGDSCKGAPSPQPSVFGAPSSATFSGSGNPVSAVTTGAVKSKSVTRARKLARALRACRRKRKRHARLVCERRARGRYAARRASSGKGTSGRGGR